MADLFADGFLVNFVLVFILAEYVILIGVRLATGRGVSALSYTANVISGGSLMLCLREALLDGRPSLMALFLMLSGLAHAGDVWSRWNR